MLEGSVVSDNPPVGDNMNLQGLSRSAALLTEAELNSLVSKFYFTVLPKVFFSGGYIVEKCLLNFFSNAKLPS